MMQNHVMQDFINQVKLMNNSMQAVTNLFSRNAAMMNSLEQEFSYKQDAPEAFISTQLLVKNSLLAHLVVQS